MITSLVIQNLILVQRAEVEFLPGFNVLTGETGSGKSAVLAALRLLLGAKTDVSLIRRGEEMGIVEAVVDGKRLRREIYQAGRSRAFVDDELLTLGELKTYVAPKIHIVQQDANHELRSPPYHRALLDDFAQLQSPIAAFQSALVQEKKIEDALASLLEGQRDREKLRLRLQEEVDEIKAAKMEEGEEEELFVEYSRLSSAEGLSQSCREVISSFDGKLRSALYHLEMQVEKLSELDRDLTDSFESFKSGRLEMEEVIYTVENFARGLSFDPERLQVLNERLALLNRLKRKYGNTLGEIQEAANERQVALKHLDEEDLRQQDLQESLRHAKEASGDLERELSERRRSISPLFADAVQRELRTLNLPHAKVSVEVSPEDRTRFGGDRVEFFMSPNLGEATLSVSTQISGGELARLMLALKTLLAEKGALSTLIFDEVDANIGGTTAALVGEKLRRIGQSQQLLCITHFSQVAALADHHIAVSKVEEAGRTKTVISQLNAQEKRQELSRMQGSQSVEEKGHVPAL